MLADGYSNEYSRCFMWFLEGYVLFSKPAIDRQFKTDVLNLEEIRKPMGIIELIEEETKRHYMSQGLRKGIRQGKLEGKLEGKLKGEHRKMLQFIQRLISGTDWDNAAIAHMTGGTPDLVQTIRARMLAGNTEIEDLMKLG